VQPRAEVAAAPTTAPAEALSNLGAEEGADATGLEGDEVAVIDNAEERVKDEDARKLQAALERAPVLPLAPQPGLLPGLRLRLYQRQALSWMIGREQAQNPVGESPTRVPSATAAVHHSDGLPLQERERDEEAASGNHIHEAVMEAAHAGGNGLAAFGNSLSVWERQTFSDGISELWLNPYTQTASLSPPPGIPPCLSGILCDGELPMFNAASWLCLLHIAHSRQKWALVKRQNSWLLLWHRRSCVSRIQ